MTRERSPLRPFLLTAALCLVAVAGWIAPRAVEPGNDVVSPGVRALVQGGGAVRVIAEMRLPGGAAVPEGRLSPAAVAIQRNDIATVRGQLLGRLAGMGHRVLQQYGTVPFVALEVGPDALAQLEASSFWVKRVVEDKPLPPFLYQSVPLIHGPQVYSAGYDGTGTVVAIVDTGVDKTHPFLVGKVVEEACYSSTVTGRSTTYCPNQTSEQTGPGSGVNCPDTNLACWHGTHVAGIAAGANGSFNGFSFSGVAKGAKIMAVQVFSKFTTDTDCGAGRSPCIMAYTSDIMKGLDRVNERQGAYNFAAVNLSLGGGLFSTTCDDDLLRASIDSLKSVRIATVVAAGNSGSTNAMSSPACISSAISVGATTKLDVVPYYSNVASFMSLFAPGDSILSSNAYPYVGGQYIYASGTSMATPHVTGAFALLKQAVPTATVDQILAALQSTGAPITDTRSGSPVTRPRIVLDAALAKLVASTSVTVSPGSVAPGGSVTAGWSGIPSPTPRDWIGLYAQGSADTAYLNWIYVSCAQAPSAAKASGSCSFGIPATLSAGTYELRLFTNDSFTKIATSSALTVTAGFNYWLSNSGSIVAVRGSSGSNTVAATLSSGGTQAVSFAASGLPTGATASFNATSCSPTCTSTLTITTTASTPVGTSTITVTGSPLGRTTTFSLVVTAPFDYGLSNSGTISVIRGNSGSNTITATLVSGASQAVSFAASGLPTGATASFNATSCSPTCSSTLTIATTASTPVGTSTITVTGSPLGRTTTFSLVVSAATSGGTTLTASPTTVARGGSVTVSWSGIASPSANDWIGLYAAGAADAAYLNWIYVSCAQTPSAAAASGSCSFGIPGTLAPGTYELRIFANNSFTKFATSNSVTVTAPISTTLTASPTTVVHGGSVTVSWSGIISPTVNDWIGLYAAGAADAAYLNWIYVSCTQAPGAAKTAGSCSFGIPGTLAPGAYELRIYTNNSFNRLATSSALTVN